MKKTIIICLSFVLVVCAVFAGVTFWRGTAKEVILESKPLELWYTDESLEDYMNNAAVVYAEKYGTKVNVHLVSAMEYLEQIQEETLHGENAPDVFLIGNDSLEKAALSGLGAEVTDINHCLNSSYYPLVALEAATYDGQIMGYPFSYNTAVFLYNDTHLSTIAQEELKKEGMEAPGAKDILARKENILPVSLVGILDFANRYDAPEGVEVFFKWDVCDILYNYMFAGAYMNLGGSCGDNQNEIDLYNEDSIYGLSLFQDFHQFFSIDSKDVEYEKVMQEFKEGKIMFTMANASCIEELERAKLNGEFAYEYGIVPIVMMNSSKKAKGLSVTQVLVVNGYGDRKQEAENLAYFLSCEYSENLFSRSGQMSAYLKNSYPYPQMEQVLATYENTTPIPKIVESSNFWMLVEKLYTECWEGADVNSSLRELSEQIKFQITGTEVKETEIETPVLEEDYLADE